MPSRSPGKGKNRYSDPYNASLTPPVSTFSRASAGSRTQSLSPCERVSKQPLHIRMNLTESQMDRITDAFTKKVDSSPGRAQPVATESPSKSTPRAHKSYQRKYQPKHNLDNNVGNEDYSESTTFSRLMPRPQNDSSYSLASRRQRTAPAPINVDGGRRLARCTPQRARMEAITNSVSPLSPREMYEAGGTGGSDGSVYTSGYHSSPQPRPLNLGPSRYGEHHQGGTSRIFEAYQGLSRNESTLSSRQAVGGTQESPSRPPRRSKSTAEGLKHNVQELLSPTRYMYPEKPATQEVETPMFSPFPFYFRGQGFPSEKRGEKIMIGEKGWLERPDSTLDMGKKTSGKKMGLLDGIKKMAKDMTELHHAGRRTQHGTNEPLGTRMAISLDAREQSLLYGELEFHLANALNSYITAQLGKGRLVTDKLKKIGDVWLQQGRPRVVGFRYDLETQLELINLHIDEFVFSGRRQGNPVEISGLLHAMKVNARAMRIRTFCQPDSVIAKQLVDAQSLFNLIGVAKAEDLALDEIAQFFKVCVEREQNAREKQPYRAHKSREDVLFEGHEPAATQPGPRRSSGGEWPY